MWLAHALSNKASGAQDADLWPEIIYISLEWLFGCMRRLQLYQRAVRGSCHVAGVERALPGFASSAVVFNRHLQHTLMLDRAYSHSWAGNRRCRSTDDGGCVRLGVSANVDDGDAKPPVLARL